MNKEPQDNFIDGAMKEFENEKWGLCFECCDYEAMCEEIKGMIQSAIQHGKDERTREVVKTLTGEIYAFGNPTTKKTEFEVDDKESYMYGYNAAIIDAINQLSK